jgi:hypothetical protein
MCRGASLSYTAAPAFPIAPLCNDYATVTPSRSALRGLAGRLREVEGRSLVVGALGDQPEWRALQLARAAACRSDPVNRGGYVVYPVGKRQSRLRACR